MNNINFKSIVLLISFSAAMLFSCSDELPRIKQFEPGDEFATVTMENLHLTYTEQGKIKGKLQSAVAKSYDGAIEPYTDFPNGISIVMYNSDNKIERSMTANKFIYYQSKKTWEAIGNVVISNINGDIMKTQKLYGNEVEKKIFTNELVNVTRADGSVVNGKIGFVSNTDFTIYKFMNVDGRIIFKDEYNGSDSLHSVSHTPEKQPVKILPERKEKPNSNK